MFPYMCVFTSRNSQVTRAHERAAGQSAGMTPLVYHNTQHVSSSIVNAQIQLLVLTLDTLFIHVQMVENNTGIKFHEVLQKNIYKCSAAVYTNVLISGCHEEFHS